MSMETVETALEQAKKMGIGSVALYTTGESLLHKRALEIARKVKGEGFYCYITSNGLLIKENNVDELVTSGIDSIKISIDGSEKEEYEKIRIGGKFDKLLKSLELLKRRRDELNPEMKIYAGAVVNKLNQHSMGRFKERYMNYVDEIYLSPLVNQSGSITEKYNELKITDEFDARSWKPCRMLWDRIVVSWEGKLTACCVDYELALSYGELTVSNMEELWTSEKMVTMRKAHLEGEVSNIDLCKTCNAPKIQEVGVLDKLHQESSRD